MHQSRKYKKRKKKESFRRGAKNDLCLLLEVWVKIKLGQRKKITSNALYLSPYILITQRLTLLYTNPISEKSGRHLRAAHHCNWAPFNKNIQAFMLFLCWQLRSHSAIFVDTLTLVQIRGDPLCFACFIIIYNSNNTLKIQNTYKLL